MTGLGVERFMRWALVKCFTIIIPTGHEFPSLAYLSVTFKGGTIKCRKFISYANFATAKLLLIGVKAITSHRDVPTETDFN